ncbi:MAG: hypothetical protein Q4B43_11245, partial [Bacteroidota bacterium]|nr:hypothetical protein [Bacteroidota bacterium]
MRWDTTPSTITSAVDDGKLLALIDKGVGSHRRFSIKYVEDIEKQGGFEALSKYDVLRVHRLETEIEKLKGII